MAIAIEQAITGGADSGNVTLTSWSPATDELVLVAISARDKNLAAPTVAGNGYTFVQVAGQVNVQGTHQIWLFRSMKTSPSSGSITITFSGNGDEVAAQCHRFSGVDTSGTNGSGAVEANASDEGPDPDDDDMLASITTITNDAWAYAMGSHRYGTFTVPGGETAISINHNQGSGGGLQRMSTWYQPVPSAGSTQLGDTADLHTDYDWTMILASIKPASAAVDDLLGADYQLNTFGVLVS